MADTPLVYIQVRTAYCPGGGPGQPAAYARRAAELGYGTLGCADTGTVAAWPAWAAACAAAGLRAVFGLELGVQDESAAPPLPVLLLARDGAGLRQLIQLHNAAQDGVLTLAALAAHASGLALICLAQDATGAGSPLVIEAGPDTRVAALRPLFGADDLYFGLPATPAAQPLLAERAAAQGLPLLALPLACYPHESDAPAHAALSAWRGVPVPDGPHQALLSPDQLAALYRDYPAAWAAAGALAARCTATLDALAPPADAAACRALAARVAADGAPSPALAAELAGLERLGLCGGLLAAADLVAAARAQSVVLGPPGGVAAAGQVAARLGVQPGDPFGAWPRWLGASPRAADGLPQVTVAACRRAAVLAAGHAGPGERLVAAGGWHGLNPMQALRVVRDQAGPDAQAVEELAGLLIGAPAGRDPFGYLRELPPVRAALAAQPALGDALVLAEALLGTPIAPAADRAVLVALPAGAVLPVLALPGSPLPVAAWPAAALAAQGWPLLRLRGEPALDIIQRAGEWAPPGLAPAPGDQAVVLAGGFTAGLPLAPPAPDDAPPGPGAIRALAAALLPPAADPPPLAWAVLGALAGGPQPHPWGLEILRRLRRAAQWEGVPVPEPRLAGLLEATGGLPVFQEQLSAAQVRLALDPDLPAGERFRLESWLSPAAPWAVPFAEAVARGQALHAAVRLKAGAPAAFLAAALTHAAEEGDGPLLAALVAEASALDVTLLPPAVDASQAPFTLEVGEDATARPAVRWGVLGVPGWTPAGVAALLAARAAAPEGRFAGLDDLCLAAEPTLVSRLALENLVRAGACDAWGPRAGLLAALGPAWDRAQAARYQAATGQLDLFGALEPAPPGAELPTAEEAAGAPAPPEPPGGDSPEDRRRWEVRLLGRAFTAPAALNGAHHNRTSAARTLRQIGPAQVGASITLPVVLAAVRVVRAPDGQPMALARAEDRSGSLPLVVFPPVYQRDPALCTLGAAVIVTVRVQQAEVAEGGGSPVVLIVERLQPYKVEAQGPQLDVTLVPQRGGSAPRASRPAKDPTRYSKSGAPYYRAPRADGLAPPDDLPEPPPDLLDPPIEAYDEPPPPNADFGMRIAEAAPAAAFRASPPPVASQEPTPPIPDPAIRNTQYAIRTVRITLPPLDDEAADEVRMRALRALLRRFPGPAPVTLIFPDDVPGSPPTVLALKYGVDPGPALQAAISELLGTGTLAVE